MAEACPSLHSRPLWQRSQARVAEGSCHFSESEGEPLPAFSLTAGCCEWKRTRPPPPVCAEKCQALSEQTPGEQASFRVVWPHGNSVAFSRGGEETRSGRDSSLSGQTEASSQSPGSSRAVAAAGTALGWGHKRPTLGRKNAEEAR